MNKEKQFEWNENRVDEFIEDIQNHISGSFRHYDFAQWKENFKQSKIEPVKQPLPEKESTFVLRLLETDSKFLETSASMIPYDGNNWYYMPFWFKKVGDNLYAEYPFDKLPNGLKKEIEKMRNMGREKALNEDTVVGSVDNFVWTEELAIHFAIELRNCKEINHKEQKSWRDSLREFKERILSEFPETQKTDTVADDNEDWDKPNKEQEQFYWDGIEKENEKQPPLVDNSNKEWEIILFKDEHDNATPFRIPKEYPSINFLNEPNKYKIYSVKRLSDGEVFTIGDMAENYFGGGTLKGVVKEILSNGNIVCSNIANGGKEFVRNIAATETPLKITKLGSPIQSNTTPQTVSTDNSDVPCLSLNDLKAALPTHTFILLQDDIQKKITEKLCK